MKKLFLLLLIAPMIGNSQMLNLPVSEVLIMQKGIPYTVPQGKILQLVSAFIDSGNDSYPHLPYNNFSLFSPDGTNYATNVWGNIVIPSGFTLTQNYNNQNYLISVVIYDLEAQNLASNVPKQTTPTLYPNPTSSLLALNSDKEYDIEVYDMAGNKVMALTGNTIDMSHLSSATYIVKALDKVENEEVSYKVVKN